jgi:hypothetical protein
VHAPFTQTSIPSHTFPQAPQFEGSVIVVTHLPPQNVPLQGIEASTADRSASAPASDEEAGASSPHPKSTKEKTSMERMGVVPSNHHAVDFVSLRMRIASFEYVGGFLEDTMVANSSRTWMARPLK